MVDLLRQGMTMEDIIKHFTGGLSVIMKRNGSNPMAVCKILRDDDDEDFSRFFKALFNILQL
jgi:hypothetical protein